MNSKYESIYRVLIAFMLIDNNVNEKEKNIILDFLETKYGKPLSGESKQISNQIAKMGIENFRIDAKIVYDNFSREEIFEILDFISNMVKSDSKIEEHEIMLFETLLEQWRIDKINLETL
jgi:uncharacterized tellurite resistance protein B-like protein